VNDAADSAHADHEGATTLICRREHPLVLQDLRPSLGPRR
jgi:hypothetical protein